MNVIVAVDQNWAIGKDGDQLIYLSEDLKRFKSLTTGHPVILGRKTLATFPGGRPLKGRRNLILSRNTDFAPEGAEVFSDVETLRAAAPEDAFVIGGASVYRQLLPWCDRLCDENRPGVSGGLPFPGPGSGPGVGEGRGERPPGTGRNRLPLCNLPPEEIVENCKKGRKISVGMV